MASNARPFKASVFRLTLLFVFALCYVLDVSDSFNIEWRNAITYHGPDSQSLFGFSIAQHKEAGRSWMVIGAPEASDSRKFSQDYRGGAVYYCDAFRNDSCLPISFNNAGNYSAGVIDNRTRQWLGATVRSSGENGKILACAPRYYWFRTPGNSNSVRDPVGTCYLAHNQFQESDEYSPCRTKGSQGYAKQGYCQVGLGAAITKDASRVYLGAVGSFYWQGQLISLSKYNRPELMSSKEGPSTEDDSYMGYSVETINFYGTNITGAVVGTPRGDMLQGKIQILTWNLTNVVNITGDQFGSYFGYSLAVADVNGDGSQDIIVGAPMFSNNSKNEYEKGRVYVFYQSLKPCAFMDFACWSTKFDLSQIIDGAMSRSRFGLSVASLGDINKDGFEDFAVGAPYEGTIPGCMVSSVTGTVYVYHGSKNGIRSTYSQKIRAEDISGLSKSGIKTFGFSLSGGLDMDDNQYPDLAVGAYESNIVYLFRSRPVINIMASLQFKSNNKMIDIDSRPNCKLNISGSWAHCVTLQMCLRYMDGGVNEKVELQVSILLDVKKSQNQYPRMFFLHSEGNRDYDFRIDLRRGAGEVCQDMVTYVVPSNPNIDKLTPLEAVMSYQLFEPLRPYDGELRPVLNMDDETPLRRQDSMRIKNNCGEDNLCIPELHMRVMPNVKQFILGSDFLIFNVSVENKGEDSFDSVFKMPIPSGVHYSKFEHFAKDNSYVHCYLPPTYDINNMSVSCNIGNPLPANKAVNFSIILQPKTKVDQREFDFSFEVNSSTPQVAALTDTRARFSIPILENAVLKIYGESKPPEVLYKLSHYNTEDIKTDSEAGPFLQHTYTIKNLGPSEMSHANVTFIWPSKTSSGEDLLYLLNAPRTSGNIQCVTYSKDANYNYKQLRLVRKNKDEIEAEKQTAGRPFSEVPYKQGQGFKPGTINHINQGSQKGGSSSEKVTSSSTYYQQGSYQSGGNIYQTGGSYQGGSQQIGGNIYQTGGSYQGGSQQTGGSIYQGGVSGSYQGGAQQGGGSSIYQTGSGSNTYQSGSFQQSEGTHHQTGGNGQFITNVIDFGGQQQSGGGVHQSGGTHQFQTSGVNVNQQNQYHQGGYISQGGQQHHGGGYISLEEQHGGSHHSSGAGGYQEGYIQTVVPGSRNYSKVYESESSYSKNTKLGENGPVTFVQGQWKKNDNGIFSNGSFSTIRPGYIEGGNFFGSQNVNTQTASGGSWSNAANVDAGSIVSQHIDQDGTILTTYKDGIQHFSPEVQVKGSESETVHHTRFENTELLTPSIGSGGIKTYVPAKPFFSGTNEEIQQQIAYDRQNPGQAYNDQGFRENKLSSRRRNKRQSINGHEANFCTADTCARIECTIQMLPKDHEVSVSFRSLVWMNTIKKVASGKPVQVGSYAQVYSNKLPTVSAEIVTNVTSLDYDAKTPPNVVPLWIVVISACVGALILMALIYFLYKRGFFKRNRPPALPERQPLNRNGNYHMGDEAL